jgi:hypothetical protein
MSTGRSVARPWRLNAELAAAGQAVGGDGLAVVDRKGDSGGGSGAAQTGGGAVDVVAGRSTAGRRRPPGG